MELDELLRRDLAADEPGGPMLPGPVIDRGRRTVRNRRLTAGVVCAVLLGGAAVVAAPRLGSPDAGPPSDDVVGIDGYRSPIHEMVQGGRDFVDWRHAVELAEVEAWNACAADAGVPQRRTPPDPARIRSEALDQAFGTPLHDDAFRAAHGYGLTDGALGTRFTEDTAWQAAPAAVLDACQAATVPDPAAAHLAGAWIENAGALQQAVLEDPAVVRAVESWESCMREQGHDVADPLDSTSLRNPWRVVDTRIRQEGPTDAVHAGEVALAEADWDCRVAHVNEAYDSTRIRLEQEYVAAHPDEAVAAKAAAERLLTAD